MYTDKAIKTIQASTVVLQHFKVCCNDFGAQIFFWVKMKSIFTY